MKPSIRNLSIVAEVAVVLSTAGACASTGEIGDAVKERYRPSGVELERPEPIDDPHDARGLGRQRTWRRQEMAEDEEAAGDLHRDRPLGGLDMVRGHGEIVAAGS